MLFLKKNTKPQSEEINLVPKFCRVGEKKNQLFFYTLAMTSPKGKLCKKCTENHVRRVSLKFSSINGLNISEFLTKIPVKLLIFRKLMRTFTYLLICW